MNESEENNVSCIFYVFFDQKMSVMRPVPSLLLVFLEFGIKTIWRFPMDFNDMEVDCVHTSIFTKKYMCI